MESKLIVAASRNDVETVLAQSLTSRELYAIRLSSAPVDPFTPEPHRDLPSFQTVLEFVASAMAAGITYDVLKKAGTVLRDKLGAARVREVESEPGTPKTEALPAPKRDGTDGGK